MGADLYIKSVNDSQRTKWEPLFEAALKLRAAFPDGSSLHNEAQKLVEATHGEMYGRGYFRDNYNGYGLFAQTSLSWWRDVGPMCDGEGNLPVEKAKELRERVLASKLCLKAAREVAKRQHDQPPTTKEYEAQRQEFVAFLDEAIQLGEPIYCSL
jgi:hypothetical protein